MGSISSKLLAGLAFSFPELAAFRHTIVVGLSSGPDSVALTHLLHQARKQVNTLQAAPLILAHFNHQLRGAESTADEDFCQSFAVKLGCVCEVGRSESPPSITSEEHLRQGRYDFLTRVASAYQARYLVLAHHRQDQIETVLFRLFRGSSLLGLKGIPATRSLAPFVTLVRPLLDVSKGEILEYLQENDLAYRTDPSNFQSNYRRNWIRNELLPQINRQWQTDVGERIWGLAHQVQQHCQLLDRLTETDFQTLIANPSGLVQIDLHHFAKLDAVLQRHLLARVWQSRRWSQQAMTAAHWQTLQQKLDPLAGLQMGQRWQAPGGIELVRTSTQWSQLGPNASIISAAVDAAEQD